MITGLCEDPLRVISSFHKNCGEERAVPFKGDHVEKLIEGLEFLTSSKITFDEPPVISNLTFVRGENDRIVRKSAFDFVVEQVGGVRTVFMESGHKVPEKDLLHLINGC